MEDAARLRRIKLIHTLVWALFAASILAIPLVVYQDKLAVAWWLIGFVFIEVTVLAANRMRCPLTAVAGRYTADRQANFDIYLPLWLARYNKRIFGTLYGAGIAYAIAAWLSDRVAS